MHACLSKSFFGHNHHIIDNRDCRDLRIVMLKKALANHHEQGHIDLPKAARGHATSYSARTDGKVLSVTKNNVSG